MLILKPIRDMSIKNIIGLFTSQSPKIRIQNLQKKWALQSLVGSLLNLESLTQ
jgi:hypothetical protein